MENAAVMAQASFAQGREGLPLRGRTMFAPVHKKSEDKIKAFLTDIVKAKVETFASKEENEGGDGR